MIANGRTALTPRLLGPGRRIRDQSKVVHLADDVAKGLLGLVDLADRDEPCYLVSLHLARMTNLVIRVLEAR